MQQKAILYGIIGLLGGILITILFTRNVVNSNNTGMMGMMGIRALNNIQAIENEESNVSMHVMPDGTMMKNMEGGMTMNDMVNDLKGKKGVEFDKAFLIGMIEHHEGAIDMANLAKQYAGHDEIKIMADSIISAQTTEIDQMRQWLKEWGN
jgi:uncharacterized protein (DUF305 family)